MKQREAFTCTHTPEHHSGTWGRSN